MHQKIKNCKTLRKDPYRGHNYAQRDHATKWRDNFVYHRRHLKTTAVAHVDVHTESEAAKNFSCRAVRQPPVTVADRNVENPVGRDTIFFFFQAEDGIRDYKVTGVQTCALPISPKLREEEVLHVNEADGLIERAVAQRVARVARDADDLQVFFDRLQRGEDRNVRARRSEERRVGKECRSRWSPYH